MRRLVVIALLMPAIAFTGLGTITASPAAAAASTPPDDPARGLVHSGLRPSAPESICRGNFELVETRQVGLPACSHGPDPAPRGVDVRVRRDAAQVQAQAAATPTTTEVTAAATSGIQCYGDGVSGNRVQLIYAHTGASRLAQFGSVFLQAAATVDSIFNASAAETGGVRHVRFVTDSSCNLAIVDVTLAAGADATFNAMSTDLSNKGYNRVDRKYLVWVDANVYCGIGNLYIDDSPGQTNFNNGKAAGFARVDNGCWNIPGQSVETHELTHTLGSVQPSAPHSTANYHCTDESDRMCYSDGPGVTMTQICSTSHENLLDCNHDDYFSTAPPAGNYLATHWNTANSSFLAPADAVPVSPTHVPADFDGDHKTDVAVYRPSTGQWYLKNQSVTNWGGSLGDVPVPGDYDGDGKTDPAIYRPLTGAWYVPGRADVFWGGTGDVPVPGDYDGNGTIDIAVFRPTTGAWYVRGGAITYWGATGDIPVPGDYDGNGTIDVAVFRPLTGAWYIKNQASAMWGATGDVPLPLASAVRLLLFP